MISASLIFIFFCSCMAAFPCLSLLILFFTVLFPPTLIALTTDANLLLSFKHSVLRDPLFVLSSWNSSQSNPCSWKGVVCRPDGRVTELSLPNSHLLGSVPATVVSIPHLRVLNLSSNFINGSIPPASSASAAIRVIDLSNNMLTGEFSGISLSLEFLDLSNNALAGRLPANLSEVFPNASVISLANNYFFGDVPSATTPISFVDLSSNLLNGSLPTNLGGKTLKCFNVSYNKLSGSIPADFAGNISGDATVDISFNNLSGMVPAVPVLLKQNYSSFYGNLGLCGIPTRTPCRNASSASSSPTSSPALAAIPNTIASSPATELPHPRDKTSKIQPGTMVAIVAGDVAGVIALFLIFYCVFKSRKKSSSGGFKSSALAKNRPSSVETNDRAESPASCTCLTFQRGHSDDESASINSSGDRETGIPFNTGAAGDGAEAGTLVTVDGSRKLEVDTLLKSSAYLIGTSGSSIMYKAVLEDGTTLAVRRIGEGHLERFEDFENQVKTLSKLVHPNLVHIRGFYWGVHEKLVIYDSVPTGSLANILRAVKGGSPPWQLPWEARLRIARGVARGLAFLHEKRHVHGNLKPSNILLENDMEPRIGDFGLERYQIGDTSYKVGSSRMFGSKRSFQDIHMGPCSNASPIPSPSPSTINGLSPYQAPEALRSLKPHAKWDVYSFGVILLELLTGKIVLVDDDVDFVGDSSRVLKMSDVAIRAELEGKERAFVAWFRLGYSSASSQPHKRPSMKEALQVVEKIRAPSFHHK